MKPKLIVFNAFFFFYQFLSQPIEDVLFTVYCLKLATGHASLLTNQQSSEGCLKHSTTGAQFAARRTAFKSSSVSLHAVFTHKPPLFVTTQIYMHIKV